MKIPKDDHTNQFKKSNSAANTPIYSASFAELFAVQSLDRLGGRGDMRDDSAEIPIQSFL